MIKTATAAFAGLSLFGFGVLHATAGDAPQQMNKSSTVDPSGPKGSNTGARPSSPGTVGAMDQAGGGSFTASKADQKKDLLQAK